jgi:very-short-patch-repair endonuclease
MIFISSHIFIYMGIFVCNICKNEFNGINSLRSHSIQKHNISAEQIYIDYVLNGYKPKCECGCGQSASFISIGKGFSKFIQSHHNRVIGKNNFHKNPETRKKSAETQKRNWGEGKYVGWWEDKSEGTLKKIDGIKEKLRNDKERGKKISKSLKGVPKTEESKIKLSITQKKRYEDNPKLKENASKRRVTWLKTKLSKKPSGIETKFESILRLINLNFEYQYEYKHRLFDFYLEKYNTLIEVDGDFYHCNPNSKHREVIYETQKLTKQNDKYKDKLCVNNDITLIRYWEKDINERPEWVISDLRNRLSL